MTVVESKTELVDEDKAAAPVAEPGADIEMSTEEDVLMQSAAEEAEKNLTSKMTVVEAETELVDEGETMSGDDDVSYQPAEAENLAQPPPQPQQVDPAADEVFGGGESGKM